MAITIRQKDTASDCAANVYCSGGTAHTDIDSRLATNTAGYGSSPVSVTLDGTQDYIGWNWDCEFTTDPAVRGAGDWTTRLNVTTGVNKCYITGIWFCRVNSSCTNQETLGSNTALNTEIEIAQVYSNTISCSAPSAWNTGDRIVVVYRIRNDNHGDETIAITPDQDIDSPWSLVAATGAPGQGTLIGVGQ
jgi:hypothetical protein